MPDPDWLIDPGPFAATIVEDDQGHLVLDNGLIRREIRTRGGCATVGYHELGSGRTMIRDVRPEAELTVDGIAVDVGGLADGEAPGNYLDASDVAERGPAPGAYRLVGIATGPTRERFPWRQRTEWMPRPLPWPPPGRSAELRFRPPEQPALGRGRLLIREDFTGQLVPPWTLHVTDAHARAAFSNEGKTGEITAPPDTCVYAERPLPTEAVEIELQADLGDDHSGGSWGPGLALVSGGRAVAAVVLCADTLEYEIADTRGGRRVGRIDPDRPVTLRVVLGTGSVRFEVAGGPGGTTLLGEMAVDGQPDALRIGRVGRHGRGKDSAAAPPLHPTAVPTRVHVRSLRVIAAGGHGDAAASELPDVTVHYELYDGVPVLAKWVSVTNTTARRITLDRVVVESLAVVEAESRVSDRGDWLTPYPYLHVETDFACGGDADHTAAERGVRWRSDPDYATQVNYARSTPSLLECGPERGPAVELAPGETFTSFRVFELAYDSGDRERNALARRRLYRTVAPWVTQSPILMHARDADDAAVRAAVDQCADVGFEMVVMTFGSGFDIETTDETEIARYRALADYARERGIALGGYALLASRSAPTADDNTRGTPATFGVMPCLGSQWGHDHLERIRTVLERTGLEVFEHDGSYPGDECAATDHPYHRGLDDSRWRQWSAITALYQWCLANGVQTHVPDWYVMSGVTTMYMGYRETNWSLPRRHQEIIERQNIFDGTWAKTPSMGWMFVPLTEYHGGGASATIEPLHDHLDHYERRLANLFGAGVQACYRGPRLYDHPETREMVARWVAFYRRHRSVLDGDIIHLRRADGRDLDHLLHVDPAGDERGLLMVYNPTDHPVTRTLTVPLYYTGLTDQALVTRDDTATWSIEIDRDYRAALEVSVPARGASWYVFTPDPASAADEPPMSTATVERNPR